MSKESKKNNLEAKSNRALFGRVLMFVFAFFFIVLIFEFAKITVTGEAKGQNLTYRTKFKYNQVSPLVAERGNIYDEDGEPLVSDSGKFSIYAILDNQNRTKNGKIDYVKDKEKTAEILSKYLSLDKDGILKYLTPQGKKPFQIEFGSNGKNISLHTKDQIESNKLPGIKFNKTPSRSYPNGIFASNLLGITKVENPNKSTDVQSISGITGVEKEFNQELSGKDGVKISKVDSNGNELPESKVIKKQSKNGDDVYLTIDSKLQDYLETLMNQIQTNYQPIQLRAVVMNSQTGAIKAMSQRPTFNPTDLSGLSNSWTNTLVEDQYEPGSPMKIVTLSAAIDSGNYDPNQYYQSGEIKIGGRTIKDWNEVGWGSIPFSQAFPRSSNVGIVNLEQKMGAETWKKYLDRFKMGQKTGITLPNETPGSISFAHSSDQAMTSFGQSIDVNSMQLLQATSAIANKGKMVKPYVVSKIVNNNSKTIKNSKVTYSGNPIKPATADEVLNSMKEVVSADYGTGKVFQIPGYENNIAVKTGTAQIPSKNGYLTGDNNFIFSVMGILPANDPKYIVYISMKQPQKMTKLADPILSEIFNPLAQRLLKENAADTGENNQVKVPNFSGKSVDDSKKQLTDLSLDPVIIGAGSKVVQQISKPNDLILKGQKVLLMTNGAITMPDVTSWSKSDILKLSEITGKKIEVNGSGYAVNQNLKPGEAITNQNNIKVTLSDP